LEEPTNLKAQSIRAEHFRKLLEQGLIGEGYAQKKLLTVKGAQLVRGIENALGPLPRSVEVLRKTRQETLDGGIGVEKESTPQHHKNGPPQGLADSSLAEKMTTVRIMHDNGCSIEEIAAEVGPALVDHCRRNGLLPMKGVGS
jgi:hypothetical protein